MKQKPLFWQLFPAFLFLMSTSLIAFFLLAYRPFNQHLINQAKSSLRNQLVIAKESILQNPDINLVKLNELFKAWDERAHMRLTLIEENGKVLLDTQKSPTVMELHNDRPEILSAIKSGQGFSIRKSETLGTDLMYAAILLRREPNSWILRFQWTILKVKSMLFMPNFL